MAIEQVLSGKDSEDEVDDDVADFEDRRVCLVILNFCFIRLFSRLYSFSILILTIVYQINIIRSGVN